MARLGARPTRAALSPLRLPRIARARMVIASQPTDVIVSIQFQDFRVLENTALPLGPFNLLVGPNGSGKTTAVRALLAVGETARARRSGESAPVHRDIAGARAVFVLGGAFSGATATLRFGDDGRATLDFSGVDEAAAERVNAWFAGVRGYALDPLALAAACPRGDAPVLAPDGAGFAAVLAAMRAGDAAIWARYLGEVHRLLPEIVDIVAGQTTDGRITFSVTQERGLTLPAETLSQGTLVVLALLAVGFAPERPSFFCLEELERGIHPRLLREVRDTLYRIAFPQDWGDAEAAVQVLTTTHSPYVLDLFADTPEDVVLATREEGAGIFKRLTDVPEVGELLQSGRLGDLWYSGILGGVP
jgi:hypothetical protein